MSRSRALVGGCWLLGSFDRSFVSYVDGDRDDEALEYFDSEVNGSRTSMRPMRPTHRSNLSSTLLGGVQSVVSAVSSLYSGAESTATAAERGGSSKSDKIPTTKANQSITRFFKQQQQEAARSNSVVEIDDPSQTSFGDDVTEEKQASGERDAGASNAAGVFNGSLLSKKTQVLLTYPYEDSESSNGKISVTHGDIARLAPGEFLNDNIIDFYLRYGLASGTDRSKRRWLTMMWLAALRW